MCIYPEGNMLSIERREAILRQMQQKRTVSVDELSRIFFTSTATIRRDLERMSKEGLVKRTYGGAVLLDGRSSDMPLLLREGENISAKERIASEAVCLVADGNSIFLDSSSTVSRLAPLLAGFSGLTVVTNALKTALALGEYENIRVCCTGGTLREKSVSLVGETARSYIAGRNADIAFFSCRGLSLEKGITEASEEEAEIKRQMISSSKTRVLLCDASKVHSIFFYRICSITDIDVLISDADFTSEERQALQRRGIRLLPPAAG